MKILVFIVILACAYAAETKEETSTQPAQEQSKDKRQTQGETVPGHFVYRTSRRQQEQVAPVEEPQDDDKQTAAANRVQGEYRRGQVFTLNAQELLELQPERKAPLTSGQHLQQLYNTDPLSEHKQNLQQFYILEPQAGHQVALHPSHAVITRPSSANGGEASVGAALSVSDASTADSFDQELLALLGHSPVRSEDSRVQAYTPVPQVLSHNSAPQYSQIERYITKPTKKATKLRTKAQVLPTQIPTAPQQYLIETTNVQQQQQQYQQQPQQQQYQQQPQQQQYHQQPQQQQYQQQPQQQQYQQQLQQYQQQPQIQHRVIQQPRPTQSLRYVPISSPQPTYYPVPENQGIKVVAAPKLQQPRGQIAYRLISQYAQPEASPKQFRTLDSRPQQVRPEVQRIPASSIDRPITYLKRYPAELEKMRAVKIFDQGIPEGLSNLPQTAQVVGDNYYIRPIYRPTEQRGRYQLAQFAVGSMDQTRVLESTKAPHSAIYVSKNVLPKKVINPSSLVRVDQPVKAETLKEQNLRAEQTANVEINGQSLEEQRSRLPPPRNNKAYTPEEFAALVAAGYSVTPVPVSAVRSSVHAQSRSSIEQAPVPANRRPIYSRRYQYLPLKGDDAP